MTFRIMTFNIAGGSRTLQGDLRGRLGRVCDVINLAQPDLLILQECIKISGTTSQALDMMQFIQRKCSFIEGHFFASMSLQHDFHADNSIMTAGLVAGWSNWEKGNAALTNVPLSPFTAGGVPSPLSFPVFRPGPYGGSRNSERRDVLCVRVDLGGVEAGIFGVHFSTLTGERGSRFDESKARDAQALRGEQARQLLAVIDAYRDRFPNDAVIVAGDSNEPDLQAPLMTTLAAHGLVRVGPTTEVPTYLTYNLVVDHFFVDEALQGKVRKVEVVEADEGASDHRAVVATLDP